MKGLANRRVRPRQRERECLCDVVDVHVVQRLRAEIGQPHVASGGEVVEHLDIEIAGGIDRRPSRSDQMSGVQDRRGNPSGPSFIHQIPFDGRLAAAVFAKRPTRLILRRRHLDAGPVNPDRPAVDEPRAGAAEGFHELDRAFERVARQIDDNVSAQRGGRQAKSPVRFFGRSIDDRVFDE